MEVIKKCKISRYDGTITKPPYVTIQIDKMEVKQPEKDNLGEEFVERLIQGCVINGYQFKFYTMSEDKDYDYEVVVC
jgi:hypothetical protein